MGYAEFEDELAGLGEVGLLIEGSDLVATFEWQSVVSAPQPFMPGPPQISRHTRHGGQSAAIVVALACGLDQQQVGSWRLPPKPLDKDAVAVMVAGDKAEA